MKKKKHFQVFFVSSHFSIQHNKSQILLLLLLKTCPNQICLLFNSRPRWFPWRHRKQNCWLFSSWSTPGHSSQHASLSGPLSSVWADRWLPRDILKSNNDDSPLCGAPHQRGIRWDIASTVQYLNFRSMFHVFKVHFVEFGFASQSVYSNRADVSLKECWRRELKGEQMSDLLQYLLWTKLNNQMSWFNTGHNQKIQ